ncbi:hypothetical protein L1I30_10250 [Gillisia sp. M10.2A]|uniref:Curlin associated repeat-containing protein n=1 Tax=Gillisia lutea TaxID=2909668 RepID=A0ABS9EKL8_9FLAO|nr:hypothetical protein [Gillisia lutea]MCF4102048.1 hypothetical protein [Gillisia lutea]
MKKLVYFSFVLMLFLVSYFPSNAQIITTISAEGYSTTNLQEWTLFSQNRPADALLANRYQQGNQIYIQQIGDGNIVESNINAKKSDVEFSQDGNDNFINLTANVKSLVADVEQNGNNNYFLDSVNSPTSNISINLTQNGDNLLFERYGSNSIGDNIRFNMTGDSKSIIVRNYK